MVDTAGSKANLGLPQFCITTLCLSWINVYGCLTYRLCGSINCSQVDEYLFRLKFVSRLKLNETRIICFVTFEQALLFLFFKPPLSSVIFPGVALS